MKSTPDERGKKSLKRVNFGTELRKKICMLPEANDLQLTCDNTFFLTLYIRNL